MKLLTEETQLAGLTIKCVHSLQWRHDDETAVSIALTFTNDTCCVFDTGYLGFTSVELVADPRSLFDKHLIALGLETTESLSRRQAREILARVTDDDVKDALRDLLSEERETQP